MAEMRNPGFTTGDIMVDNVNPYDQEYTDEVPMILGSSLPNPYSITNMVETYNTYYAANLVTVPVTHYYVRFSPANESQLALLEDSLEVEIFDYPLNYEVLQDGDYYQQPGKGAEDMPDFFAVVPNTFQFPSGVPHVILEDLHFPHDDPILEALAESIAAGGHYNSYQINNGEPDIMMTRIENNSQLINENNCACFPNPEDLACIPPDPNCYIPPSPPPPGGWQPPTPGPAPANTPSGYIRYQDNTANIDRPLRGVEVIAKRGRKTAKAYTDNNGFFVMGRNFPGPVKIIIKYRTSSTVNIKPLRLQRKIRLSLLTARQRCGSTYGVGVMNNLNIRIVATSNVGTRQHMYWLAAHAVDSRYEQTLRASIDQLKHFSGHRAVVYLSRRGFRLGRAPEVKLLMLNYIAKNKSGTDLLIDVAKIVKYAAFGDPIGIANQLLQHILAGLRPDIMFHYNTDWANMRSNVTHQKFISVYTEAGVLKGTNNGIKWKHHFKAKDKEIGIFTDPLRIYKTTKWIEKGEIPTDTYWSSLVADIGLYIYYSLTGPEKTFFEMTLGFSEYYSHLICDKWYENTTNSVRDQTGKLINSTNNSTSHKLYLENWRPNVSVDLYKENRIGYFYDLNDNNITPELIPSTTIPDNVELVKSSDMYKSITGWTGGNPYWQPEAWWQFRDNVRYFYPFQSNQILGLSLAYF